MLFRAFPTTRNKIMARQKDIHPASGNYDDLLTRTALAPISGNGR